MGAALRVQQQGRLGEPGSTDAEGAAVTAPSFFNKNRKLGVASRAARTQFKKTSLTVYERDSVVLPVAHNAAL